MRGTPIFRDPSIVGSRIIPAHAGNSAPQGSPANSRTDHPRACGELPFTASRRNRNLGSSPRMRGTPCQTHQPCRRWRIIPAHAGNSATHPIQTAHQPDHPRACGELMMSLRELSPPDGSSPRMRGTRGVHRGAVHTHRIIPAHAGNSATWLPRARSNTDHPRACGELIPRPGYENSVYGSSPRMRGTRSYLRPASEGDRIIPAHAGNSGGASSASCRRPDHPRACGELST